MTWLYFLVGVIGLHALAFSVWRLVNRGRRPMLRDKDGAIVQVELLGPYRRRGRGRR